MLANVKVSTVTGVSVAGEQDHFCRYSIVLEPAAAATVDERAQAIAGSVATINKTMTQIKVNI